MSSFSMFGTCQGCGLTQYMQGQPCRDCGGHVQQGGVRKLAPNELWPGATSGFTGRWSAKHPQHSNIPKDGRAIGKPKAFEAPYGNQRAHCDALVVADRIRAAVMDQYTAFLNRAVNDCLSRLGLTLTEAVQRLTRHVGPSWEELYLDGERVLRLDWEYVGERGFCMTRKFHGPAELPAT